MAVILLPIDFVVLIINFLNYMSMRIHTNQEENAINL